MKIMCNILINKKELNQAETVTEFLKILSPEMQERIKTIIWWESLKTSTGEIQEAKEVKATN